MKPYRADVGVQLDPSFTSHLARCEQCAQFDASQPASAALLCLEGSVLWKRENKVAAPRQLFVRDGNKASKDEIRRITKYVGEA